MNHITEQTETRMEDKEKLLSENEKMEQQQINVVACSIGFCYSVNVRLSN